MIIKNGSIFGENGRFCRGNIDICGDVIKNIDYDKAYNVELQQKQEEVIDADGLYVIPGLVDIHLHGAAGFDFCDCTEEAFAAIVDFELSHGVTSIVPATMTLPQQTLYRIMGAIGQYAKNHASIKGITMEGPFISADKKGAQNEGYIQVPDITLFNRLQTVSGKMIRQVTVAPETAGALDFIKNVSENCVVAVAHTNASYEEAEAAFSAGSDHITHLYNAMPPFGHREPGAIGAERVCMISDSMSAAGMKDGECFLGEQKVIRKGRCAVLENGSLAGAVSTLYDNLKTAVTEMHIPLEDAVLSCTATPARSLKLDRECGVLAAGRKADAVLLDKDLNIMYVIKSGRILI